MKFKVGKYYENNITKEIIFVTSAYTDMSNNIVHFMIKFNDGRLDNIIANTDFDSDVWTETSGFKSDELLLFDILSSCYGWVNIIKANSPVNIWIHCKHFSKDYFKELLSENILNSKIISVKTITVPERTGIQIII